MEFEHVHVDVCCMDRHGNRSLVLKPIVDFALTIANTLFDNWRTVAGSSARSTLGLADVMSVDILLIRHYRE